MSGNKVPYKKMYIAILDDAPDYMVPTLVAHSILSAHGKFMTISGFINGTTHIYLDWYHNSFRKVVIRVGRKEYDRIKADFIHHEGHENTICGGQGCCLVLLPVESDSVPNVLRCAAMWKPKEK